ncbi:MAG TPA: Trp biosynthesis-associated membrane protein [Humibacter sp.]|nr:Trp biosynthesis-associated membrane protein [Humibacter sp.]
MRRARSLKYGSIAAFVLSAGLALTASTQDWFGFHLAATTAQSATVMAQGSVAAPGLTALSLAGIALAGALAMAGRFARLMLGILGVVLGFCILWSSAAPLADPIAVGAPAITKQTGVAGDSAVHHLVTATDVMAWPAVGIASGVIFTLASLAVIVTFTAWPSASRRYDVVRFADADANDRSGAEALRPDAADADHAADRATDATSAEHAAARPETASAPLPDDVLPDDEGAHARDAAIDSWDDLSRGDDPTT